VSAARPRLAFVAAWAAIAAGCADARPVVDGGAGCGADMRRGIHECGILDPDSPDFHGALIRSVNWDLQSCAQCHGEDFSGGSAQSSCLGCHPGSGGPTGCATCHGAPPSTGAHAAHAAGTIARPFDCTECHLKPRLYTDVGHILGGDGTLLPPPAVVRFGALAAASVDGVTRAGAPSWNGDSAICSNVYCHGAAFADAKAARTTPDWKGGASEAACGACHGLPPADHGNGPGARCELCHPAVAGAALSVSNPALHVDGQVQLGDGSGACWACHGTTGNPAPPRDLSGNTDPSAIGVGAHAAHVGATHRLSAPVLCGDCHVVPTALADAGHIDHDLPATVFPPAALTGSLSAADGAMPAWDHASARCANVYCHGGGATLSTDQSAGLERAPLWTGGTSEAACGGCHGVPPVDGSHQSTMTLDHCADCHPKTMDASGAIIVSGAPGALTSMHINGVVDVQMP
jgi:predicted CxxxxCH...CXXCH cytochrome family protein